MEIKVVCLLLTLFISVLVFAVNGKFQECFGDIENGIYPTFVFDCVYLDEQIDHIQKFDEDIYASCTFGSLVAHIGEYYQPVKSQKINEIVFRNCRFPHLPHKFFKKLGDIDNVKLIGCGIETISAFEFPEGSVLKVLTMTYNEITKIPEYFFSSTVEKVKNIDFSHNQITEVERYAFKGVEHKLETINLAHNYIETLDLELFKNLTNLTELDLSHNLIQTFNADLQNCKHLKILNLANNKIVYFQYLQLNEGFSFNFFVPYLENLSEIYLQNNNLKDINGWMSLTTKILNITNNDFSCRFLERFVNNMPESVLLISNQITLKSGNQHDYHINCNNDGDRDASAEDYDLLESNDDQMHSSPLGPNNLKSKSSSTEFSSTESNSTEINLFSEQSREKNNMENIISKYFVNESVHFNKSNQHGNGLIQKIVNYFVFINSTVNFG